MNGIPPLNKEGSTRKLAKSQREESGKVVAMAKEFVLHLLLTRTITLLRTTNSHVLKDSSGLEPPRSTRSQYIVGLV